MKKRKQGLLLAGELLLTLCMAVLAALGSLASVSRSAGRQTEELASDYEDMADRYISLFRALTIQVREKIAEDPSFDEMQTWLMSHDDSFRDAIGADIYDGFAMTYKGGYAHSWNYGDYTDYVPAERPWYIEAQKAGGEAVLVPPYISYLGEPYLQQDQIITMTIAQHYSSTISFDLDLKIAWVNSVVNHNTSIFEDARIFFYNADGYILGSTDSSLYCRNISKPDSIVSADLSRYIQRSAEDPDHLTLASVDGQLQFLYASRDPEGNTYCVVIPFWSLAVRTFGPVLLATVLLILLEIFIYRRNRRILREMSERDARMAEITKAAFQKTMYIDVSTMSWFSGTGSEAGDGHGNYREEYVRILAQAADEGARGELNGFISPTALAACRDEELTTRKIPMILALSDGTRVRATMKISRFRFQSSGKTLIGILENDITQEEQDRQDLLTSITGMYDTVLIGNVDTGHMVPVRTDHYYEETAGREADYAIACVRFAEQYIGEKDRPAFLDQASLDTIRRQLSQNSTCSFTAQLNSGHWMIARVTRGKDFDQARSFIMFIENADEQMRRQTELNQALARAREATSAKTEFLSRMSHDIRTPMNGIIGMTRLAMQQENSAQTDDCLKKIDLSSKYLLGLLNDILDMTKIESGEVTLSPEPYPHEEQKQYLESVIQPLCDARHHHFDVEFRTAEGCLPMLDKLRFNQIVFNLLANAAKYTPEGGDIRYQLEEQIEGSHMIMTVIVSDNGIGMSEDFQRVLFRPYTQENRPADRKDRTAGTGLGLAIVKSLVDLMKGTISVTSHRDEGTVFTLRWQTDYMRETEYAASRKTVLESGDRERLSGRRILCCEDNPINREIAGAILQDAGIQMEMAEDGSQGLQMYKDHEPGYYDAILMDIRMPVMDGYETARAIRSSGRADAASIPVIAMSADAFREDVRKAMAAGMNGHIAKPVTPEAVYEALLAHFPA